MNSIQIIKAFIVSVFSSIATYFSPLIGEFQSLLLLFSLNFIAGLLAALLVEHGSFNFKKAFSCIREMTIFFVFVASIYFIGDKKGNSSGAVQCVSFVSYVVIWFYSQNIIRNLSSLFPKGTNANKIFNFLYYVVSVEFVKKIPYLKDFKNL